MNSIIQSPHNTTPIPKTEEDILIIYIMSHPTYYYTSNYPQMQNFNLLKKLQIDNKYKLSRKIIYTSDLRGSKKIRFYD